MNYLLHGAEVEADIRLTQEEVKGYVEHLEDLYPDLSLEEVYIDIDDEKGEVILEPRYSTLIRKEWQ